VIDRCVFVVAEARQWTNAGNVDAAIRQDLICDVDAEHAVEHNFDRSHYAVARDVNGLEITAF